MNAGIEVSPPPDDDEPNFGPDPWGSDLESGDIERDWGPKEEPEYLTNRDI